ncbi:flagellar hook-length control protein FliK [Pollutimonas sp. M17]|uniref:flagellar hook-length control protein FliK n=1 Tax=Pollutimonas sp. M17 TaxID=2962065 RepID=UPI0021F47BBE|nr:flagellar hook-length control protein FliK [Pollutimonas sp. M17]UYO94974.1 flagellar hook-length control protein FliK [Pollutimonas sp. M17]
MNTPTISAVSPVAPGNAGRAQGSGGSEPESAIPFSAVLTRQQGAEPARAAAAAEKGQGSAAEGRAATGKNDHAAPGKNTGAPAKEDDDAALAQAAGEQGLTLPQIALTIAGEAAAVQQSSLAAAGKPAAQPIDARLAAAQDRLIPGQDKAPAGKSSLAAALASSKAGADASAAALRQAVPAGQSIPDIAGKTSAPAISLAPVPPTAVAAPHQTLLGANKAASLAGARQAVLAMQARAQASPDGQAKLALPEISTFMAGPAVAITPDAGMAAGTADPAAMPVSSLAAGQSALGIATPNGSAPLASNGLPAAHPAIGAPLQSPQWPAEFGRQFVSIAQGGHNMPHTAELRLDPPELGPLRITINISDNVAHAVFVSPHAGVRQAVENAMSQLQQSLAQAGISLGQTSVSDQGQPQQAFNETFGGSRRDASGGGQVAGLDSGGISSPAVRSRAPDALVDTFA